MPRPAVGDRYVFRLDGAPDKTIELPSVTSIIKTVFGSASGAMAYWGFRLGIQSQHPDLPEEEIERLYEQAKAGDYAPNRVRDRAGTRGTMAHALLEALATQKAKILPGEDLAIVGEVGDEKFGEDEPLIPTSYLEGVARWWDEKIMPCVFAGYSVTSEDTVWSLRYLYAGTYDLLLSDPWGKRIVYDLKTHKPAPNGPAYFEDRLQLAAYRLALQEMGIHVPLQVVVLVTEDGQYLEDDTRIPIETWPKVMEVYQEVVEHGGA